MIKEKFVKNSVIEWLKKNQWKITATTYRTHGIDIKANRRGAQYIIECKGETKSPNVSYNESFGQIISEMTHKNIISEMTHKSKSNTNYYGLAFPDTKRYRELFEKKLPDSVRKKLKLRLIFVSQERNICEIKSSQIFV